MPSSTASSFLWTKRAHKRDGPGLTPLRVLHTESSLGWGGQELRVLAESAGLAERGHEVTIAAPPESRILGEAGKRGIPCRALPIAGKSVAGVLAMRRAFLDLRPSVVNCHSSSDSWTCAFAARFVADPPPLVRTRHISAPIPGNVATRWLYRRATAHVVTTGESLRLQVMRETGLGATRVSSVPTGLDLERFSPGDQGQARAALGLPRESFLVGIVATLRSWKGHRYLVEAVGSIADSDLRLIIVGDGPGRDNLREQVGALSLGKRVIFAGEQADVVPWMRSFDVFVLPSYANEGVPQAIMQAMACGIPVITTSVGAIPEIVRDGETGAVIPVRDSSAIANAIGAMRTDPERWNRFAQSGHREAQARFSSAFMLDGMEAVFESVTKQRRPS